MPILLCSTKRIRWEENRDKVEQETDILYVKQVCQLDWNPIAITALNPYSGELSFLVWRIEWSF